MKKGVDFLIEFSLERNCQRPHVIFSQAFLLDGYLVFYPPPPPLTALTALPRPPPDDAKKSTHSELSCSPFLSI